MRTKRALPGSPFGGRFEGALGAGSPQQRAALTLTRGFERGGILVEGHYRNFEDWQSPEGEVFNSGSSDHGFLVRFDHLLGGGLFSLGWQSDFARDIERPRDDSDVVRFYYPTEDSNRLTLSWERGGVGTFSRLGVNGFFGSYALVTDQDRFATASTPRSIERADVSADDFHLRAYAQKPLGRARLEAEIDLNGRVNLEALEVREQYDAGGSLATRTELVSVGDARRVDAACYASVEAALGRVHSLSAGLRGDLVTSKNQGGYFGDRDTTKGPSPATPPRVSARQPASRPPPRWPAASGPHALRRLPGPHRPRLHHRQPRPGSRDEPATRPGPALLTEGMGRARTSTTSRR